MTNQSRCQIPQRAKEKCRRRKAYRESGGWRRPAIVSPTRRPLRRRNPREVPGSIRFRSAPDRWQYPAGRECKKKKKWECANWKTQWRRSKPKMTSLKSKNVSRLSCGCRERGMAVMVSSWRLTLTWTGIWRRPSLWTVTIVYRLNKHTGWQRSKHKKESKKARKPARKKERKEGRKNVGKLTIGTNESCHDHNQ